MARDIPRVRAGQLRHRVTLQRSVVAAGGIRSWVDLVANLPAAIEPQSGYNRPDRELGAPAETLYEITIRGLPNQQIRPRMRVLTRARDGGTRVLEIVDVQDLRELNRVLILQCKEVTT